MNDNEKELIKKKIKYFFDNFIKVHIDSNDNPSRWYNGIIHQVNNENFILRDFKKGEMVLFYEEIKSVSQYFERNKNEK